MPVGTNVAQAAAVGTRRRSGTAAGRLMQHQLRSGTARCRNRAPAKAAATEPSRGKEDSEEQDGSKRQVKPAQRRGMHQKGLNSQGEGKKRAAGKRATLNVSQQKTAPTTHTASSAGQGQ